MITLRWHSIHCSRFKNVKTLYLGSHHCWPNRPVPLQHKRTALAATWSPTITANSPSLPCVTRPSLIAPFPSALDAENSLFYPPLPPNPPPVLFHTIESCNGAPSSVPFCRQVSRSTTPKPTPVLADAVPQTRDSNKTVDTVIDSMPQTNNGISPRQRPTTRL